MADLDLAETIGHAPDPEVLAPTPLVWDDDAPAVCPRCGGDPDYTETRWYDPMEAQPPERVPCPVCGGGKTPPRRVRAILPPLHAAVNGDVQCPNCGMSLPVYADYAGEPVQCPVCNALGTLARDDDEWTWRPLVAPVLVAVRMLPPF